jgi:hypothetical protein
MIDNREDGVVPLTFGERRDQVHGYDLERKCLWGNWDFVYGDSSAVRECLVLLAHCTPLHIICDPLIHAWPPI